MMPGSTRCELCNPGSFVNGVGQSSPTLCPKNTFSSEFAATQCDPCPAGLIAPIPGAVSCEDALKCGVGEFSTIGYGDCRTY